MMDAYARYLDAALDSAAWFVACFIIFGVLQRFFPSIPSARIWRRDMFTDAVYWFVMPWLYAPVQALLVTLGAVAYFGGDTAAVSDFLLHGSGVFSHVPLYAQFLIILFVSDVAQYWIHRQFHRGGWWKFHAVHHSSTIVDWLSSVRFHPVNFVLAFTTVSAAIVLLGFSPAVFVLLKPFNILYSTMVHANLNWSFGKLKYVFASPVFHRWHHTLEKEGRDKNFAPTFAFLDVLFGTFYMPVNKQPLIFGIEGDPVPESFIGQLAYPLKA